MSALLGIIEKEKSDSIRRNTLLHMQTILCHPNDHQGEIHTFVLSSDKAKSMGGAITINEKTNTCSKTTTIIKDGRNQVITAVLGTFYNKQELYALIKGENSELEDDSDSGILCHLYARYGILQTLSMIDGAYALCVVDVENKKVYLARDRFGEKPLYYYYNGDLFLFASEYKAFYCHSEFKAELNENAVSEYFIFRYPAGEYTFLKDVYLVPPASCIELSPSELNKKIYWHIPEPSPNDYTFERNKEELRKLLTKSVQRCIESKYSTGVQLSGGVDSSVVANSICELTNSEIRSYSITVDDNSISEESYIDYVNDQLQFKSHKYALDSISFLNNWEKATWYYESPLQHEGNIPLLQLNAEAKKEVEVLLCGDGADECMGGYSRFSRIMKYRDSKKGLLWRGIQIKNLLKGRVHYRSLDEYFISLSQFLKDDEIKLLRPTTYKSDIKNAYSHRMRIMQESCPHRSIHRYLQYEMRTYMLDTLLRGYKMSAASSLEMRAPLLMTELVEFLQTVPEKYLVDSSKPFMYDTKILLKSLCEDFYGERFTYRNKIGLGVPMHKILSDEKVRHYMERNILPGIKNRGVVNYEYVLLLWNQVDKMRTCMDSRLQVLWTAISFEMWAQMYIDKAPI